MEKMEMENPCYEEKSDDEDAINQEMESEKSSSDDDDDDDIENKKEVERLEQILIQNPYDYASHLALITLFKKMGELDKLRQARQNMSEKYPLSSDIWLAWLRDEMKLATTKEQKNEIINLCERAVQDYLCTDIWLEYLQFSIGNMGSEENAKDNVRDLFERALTATGLHFTKGAIIWEAFREFEVILYQMIDPNKESEKKKQLDKIATLFRRQLACPLLSMKKTLEEFEIWRKEDGALSTVDNAIVKVGYERALLQRNLRLPFEERVVPVQTDAELLDAYNAYLLFEKQHGDPGRITILYERAISSLSLESSLWLDFITYVEEYLKSNELLEKLYQRSSRNVPWCMKIWQKWIRFYEKLDKQLFEVQTLMENALAAGFQTAEEYRGLWMVYLEYLRRRIDKGSENDEDKNLEILRNNFNKACDHLARHFGMEGDPNCIILQYWARTEAIHARDMEKARSIWADILSQGHSISAASWMEYISLERCYGDTKHLRKLFLKALNSVKDWPENIASSWIDFERDEGTIEQLEYCESKSKERLDKIMDERNKSQNQISHEPSTSTSNILHTKKINKRRFEETAKWKHLEASPQKMSKFDKPINDTKISPPPGYKVETDKKEIQSHKQNILPPPGYKEETECEKMEEDDHWSQEVNHKITVFISNLDYSASEEDIRATLEPAGPITLFKMVKDFKGRSKGFCYVQLNDELSVEKALKLDRTPIAGRPMFVSRCNPNKNSREGGFKYSCSLEKNKLFVKGLAVTTDKNKLEELYQVYGALKEVRIVTYRNGHSKGIAYVEFEDEANAKKALLATDGTKIDGKIISVAISKPPDRKKTIDDDTPLIKSLGGSSTSRSTFGVPKTVLSMIPRNVKTISNKTDLKSGYSISKPMSNEDFRSMLLKK